MKFFKKLKIWIKNKYYERQAEKFVNASTGSGDSKFLDPFNAGRDIDFNANPAYYQDDIQEKYHEAILQIKRKINSSVKEKNTKNYEEALKKFIGKSDDWKEDLQVNDLLDLADKEKIDPTEQLIRDIVVYKDGIDIKSEEQKLKMIDRRIEHYNRLKIQKQIRKLNRELRKAQRSGDDKLTKELWGKIDELKRSLKSTKKDKHSVFRC